MEFERLKERQRAERHGWPENLALRVHRALSWLHRAEQLAHADDTDAGRKRFESLTWQEFPKSIRVLLDNRYVFADFWHWQNGSLSVAAERRPLIVPGGSWAGRKSA